MSNSHDHPHDHPHDHAHEHAHPDPITTAPPAPPIEDAGAQALDEALGSSFKVIKFLMFLLVAAFAFSGLFTVKSNEVAVVLHFGKIRGNGTEQILKPGIHYALPYPIDEVVRMPVGQSISVTTLNGWHALSDDDIKSKAFGATFRPGVDGYNLTGDGNIINSRATLKYRLTEQSARDYYFNFVNTTNTLRAALENSLIYAASQMSADAAIFLDKATFKDLAKGHLESLLSKMGLSINIDNFEVITIAPPMVQDIFDAVITVQQLSSKTNHEAETWARVRTNSAFGEAGVIINEAMTRSNQLVVTVRAEAKAFSDQLPSYLGDPDLFKQRLMAESMQQILAGARDKFFIPTRSDGNPRELRLQLNREPLKEKE